MLPPRVGVETCALGNFWLGAQVRIPRLPGPRSIYPLADLAQLKALTTRENLIHRILPVAFVKMGRYCYLAVARLIKRRYCYPLSSSAAGAERATTIIATSFPTC